jgi:hypothetical protein
MRWVLVVFIASALAFGTAAANATPSSCRPQKFCSTTPTPRPDPCDTGGVTGKTVAEVFWDGFTGPLNGIAGDPSGNWGPVSGAIYDAGNGSPAATEASCLVNSAPWGSPL